MSIQEQIKQLKEQNPTKNYAWSEDTGEIFEYRNGVFKSIEEVKNRYKQWWDDMKKIEGKIQKLGGGEQHVQKGEEEKKVIV